MIESIFLVRLFDVTFMAIGGIGLLSVYFVFLLIAGALNSLVTRFKTHFVTKSCLKVISSWLLFLFDSLSCSSYLSLGLKDGLCKVSCDSLIYEAVLLAVALGILFVEGVYAKRTLLGLICLPNLIGIIAMLSSNDWLVTITGWELFNLSIYLLVSIHGHEAASIKYFILSAVTTTFILLAVALVYAVTATTNYQNILLSKEKNVNENIEYLLISLFFKLGAVPLHNWAPDLYDRISFPLVLWVILIPKLAVLGLLIQINDFFTSLGSIIGIFSLVGSVALSSQWRLKRFLAYSAISNLGFILLTLGTLELKSYLYYIVIYAIALLIIGTLGRSFQLNLNLPLGLSWAISLFSLAGIPPLAGFYAKFLVFYSLLDITFFPLLLAVIILTTLSAANYLSLIKVTIMDLPLNVVFLCPVAVSYFISSLTFVLLIGSFFA